MHTCCNHTFDVSTGLLFTGSIGLLVVAYMVRAVLETSILGRAQSQGQVRYEVTDIRDFAVVQQSLSRRRTPRRRCLRGRPS